MKKIGKKLIILLLFGLVVVFGINEITVVKAEENIQLNRQTMTIALGGQGNLSLSLPDSLKNSTVTWSSSDKIVATVNNGVVSGKSPGVTIITASAGSQKTTCTVTVTYNYVEVTGITLNKSSATILKNAITTLAATIYPENASDKYTRWSSSDPSVATVSDGVVTAKSVGTTIITAIAGQQRTTCRINVVDTIYLNGISLNKTTTNIKEQTSENLVVTFNPANATNKKLTWKSSNSKIVTVDESGKITAVSAGDATITVISNDGGHVATCKVTVTAISKALKDISLNKKELILESGKDSTLVVTYNPTYAENKKVKWESSDEDIATVEEGKVTAKSIGNAEITVTSEDGEKKAICKVTVTAAPIKSIKFTSEETKVYIGSVTKLKTKAEPTDSAIENPIWTSSDENVATVKNGTVTAIAIGETTITVSNKDGSIKASTIVKVEAKPKEPLNITIEGYDLKFDPDVKTYKLNVGFADSLDIKTNSKTATINGNKDLKNGSVISITIEDDEKVTYVINIEKNDDYTLYFIGAVSVLLFLNLIRIIIKNKKKKSKKF